MELTTIKPQDSIFYGKRMPLKEGQLWASLHGGMFDLFEIIEILPGQYLRRPDVAFIPCEFCRVRWLTGRLQGLILDQRSPDHELGGGDRYVLMSFLRKESFDGCWCD